VPPSVYLLVAHTTVHHNPNAAAPDYGTTRHSSIVSNVKWDYITVAIDGEFRRTRFGEYAGFPDAEDFFERSPPKVCYFDTCWDVPGEVRPVDEIRYKPGEMREVEERMYFCSCLMCRTMAHGEEIVEYTTEGGKREIVILELGKDYSSLSLPTGALWNLEEHKVRWEEKKRKWREARRKWWVAARANYDAKERLAEQALLKEVETTYSRLAKVVSVALDLGEEEQKIWETRVLTRGREIELEAWRRRR